MNILSCENWLVDKNSEGVIMDDIDSASSPRHIQML